MAHHNKKLQEVIDAWAKRMTAHFQKNDSWREPAYDREAWLDSNCETVFENSDILQVVSEMMCDAFEARCQKLGLQFGTATEEPKIPGDKS